MIGGLRNQRDGYTYFGYKRTNSYNKIINDYVLSNPNNIVIDTENVFKIWYNNGKILSSHRKEKILPFRR